MYGKNLTFKTGGVDGCDCAEILRLIEQGKLDTTPLITHRFPLSEIEEAYRIFENRLDGVIKVALRRTEAGESHVIHETRPRRFGYKKSPFPQADAGFRRWCCRRMRLRCWLPACCGFTAAGTFSA